MKIQFDSLQEIRKFILMVNLEMLCAEETEFGTGGFIITNREYDVESKRDEYASLPSQSKACRRNSDTVVITPYYRELSWLFKVLLEFMHDNNGLGYDELASSFSVCCHGYFIINPEHYPLELMLFILDGLKRVMDQRKESGEKESR